MYLLKRLISEENQRINHTGYNRNDIFKKNGKEAEWSTYLPSDLPLILRFDVLSFNFN